MLKWFIPTVIAVLCGLLTLLGALLPVPAFSDLRTIFVRWAAVITVFAFILAYTSLLKVHIARIIHQRKDRIASIILLFGAISTLIIVIFQGPDGNISRYVVENILIPGEAALLAITSVTLILAGMRVFRTRRDFYSVLFLLAVVLALFGAIPAFYNVFIDTALLLLSSAATAGIRGLLLGVVLGITLTGLRIIFGIERPYSNE